MIRHAHLEAGHFIDVRGVVEAYREDEAVVRLLTKGGLLTLVCGIVKEEGADYPCSIEDLPASIKLTKGQAIEVMRAIAMAVNLMGDNG